jgi:hypothetical protein
MFEFEKEFAGLLKEFHKNGALEHLVLIGGVASFIADASESKFSLFI